MANIDQPKIIVDGISECPNGHPLANFEGCANLNCQFTAVRTIPNNLDEILRKFNEWGNIVEAKTALKEYFMELLGEDEETNLRELSRTMTMDNAHDLSVENVARNELRNEIRTRLEKG